MPVDISDVLHVLAHELRTPAGIAQGYLRMLLEDRLPDAEERRRALEAAQKAVARVTELTNESSQLAGWMERSGGPPQAIDARMLIDKVMDDTRMDPPPALRSEIPSGAAAVSAIDARALVDAVAALVRATARELRNKSCTIAARVDGRMMEVLIGSEEQFAALAAAPAARNASPLALERGGVGLSLVIAAAVLDSHGAAPWTVNGWRTTVGIRLPIHERAHQ